MNEDDWYNDNDFLISFESLSPFIIEGLVRIDSQVFGLVSSFPYAFICGTIASSIVILILVQITLKTLIVATGSFLAANITAYLFGRRLGRRFEQWHLYLLIEYKKTRITQSTKDNNDKENLITSHQNDIDNENNNQNRIRPILKGRPRNWYFKMTFVVIVIIANILGMLIGGLCAANLPSRLRNNTEPWQDDYYK